MPLVFENTYARLPEQFYERSDPTPVAEPRWLAVNDTLADELGLTQEERRGETFLAVLAGNTRLPGSEPIALAYAGHQFGGFVPKLGDGRAILLGEVRDVKGVRLDVQLKGAGRTSFSRRGDGRAALGPVLREFLVSEAMFNLGVPTTRSLAAVATGERVYRETPLPGAVLTRVASSHLRVGTFEYFGRRRDVDSLQLLVDYALSRHYPERRGTEFAPLTLLDAVVTAQARLVAKWMNLGFVHGVMNTDNCSIAGETIDYGPCAFLDTFEPRRTFSSIDSEGRYAYVNQPPIALWNMARFAEALLPLFGDVTDEVVKRLETRLEAFMPQFEAAYGEGLCAKLGLAHTPEHVEVGKRLLDSMHRGSVDFTLGFRQLTELVASERGVSGARARAFLGSFKDEAAVPDVEQWLEGWWARVQAGDVRTSLERMAKANPVFIPRNHHVEAALAAAAQGDLAPFERMYTALRRPFDEGLAAQPEFADLTTPPGEEQWDYCTFCGT
jgi:uncharacterized protein YdiU (UPF0061 family)